MFAAARAVTKDDGVVVRAGFFQWPGHRRHGGAVESATQTGANGHITPEAPTDGLVEQFVEFFQWQRQVWYRFWSLWSASSALSGRVVAGRISGNRKEYTDSKKFALCPHSSGMSGQDSWAAFFISNFQCRFSIGLSFRWRKRNFLRLRNSKMVFRQSGPAAKSISSFSSQMAKSKHVVELLQAAFFPVIVGDHDHFGVRLRSKTVSLCSAKIPDLCVIVYPPFVNNVIAPGIGHGLGKAFALRWWWKAAVSPGERYFSGYSIYFPSGPRWARTPVAD